MSPSARKVIYELTYNPILEYWAQVQNKRIRVCRKIRMTLRKLVKDIENPRAWHYDYARANHAIEFVENYCRHSQGSTGPIILELWEKAFIAGIFGFIDNDGYRKYRRAVLIVAKKNGKSLIASAIGLYLQIADGEMGPEVVAAATTRDQAKKIWEVAKNMVLMSPVLRKRIKALTSELSSKAFNFGTFKPLSSDYNTLDGLNLHGVLMDEMQQWKNGLGLYDILSRGISARKQPLILITTTAGTIREDIYDMIYDECELIINGYEDIEGYKDERTLAFIYELDSRKEWTNEENWVKANPGLGTIKNIDILRDEVTKEIANPSRNRKNLLCKDFNVRETSTESWLTFEQLNNTEKFDIAKLKPRYGILGIDLSQSVDLTAACLMFKIKGDDKIYCEHMYWLPEDLLEQRTKEDKIPYMEWRQQGFLRTTPGKQIDYRAIIDWMLELQRKNDCYIYKVGYDSWSATYFVKDVERTFGINTPLAVPQTMKELSAPMQTLGAELDAKNIVYNNNPITKWCLSNTAIIQDKNGNQKPAKTSNQRRRIDGLAAMLDAYVVYQKHMEDYNRLI